MKTAVVYDDAGYFVTGKEVPDNYQLANNETFLVPPSNLLKPRFAGNAWTGMSQEDFDKATIDKDSIRTDPSLKGMIQQLGTSVAQMSAALNKIEGQLKQSAGGNTNGQA